MLHARDARTDGRAGRRLGVRGSVDGEESMDDLVNRFARELADAIATAIAESPQVEACRERARAAGFEMKVTLEAVVGFVNRPTSGALTKVTAATPARAAQQRRGVQSSLQRRKGDEAAEEVDN